MPVAEDRISLNDGSYLDVQIDFEMWCARCGEGICGDVRQASRYRKNDFQVFCSKCDKEFDGVIKENEELTQKIIELEDEIERLTNEAK